MDGMIVNIPLYKGSPRNTPNKIIVHAMAEYIHDGIDYHAVDYLKKLGLSAHSLITPSGVNIRCRNDTQGAYHAKNHNIDTLGIEILVPGVHTYISFLNKMKTEYITDVQYSSLVDQCRKWIELYDIVDVLRHSDIDPDRKKDPGSLNWQQFLQDIHD